MLHDIAAVSLHVRTVKLLFIAITGIYLGIPQGSHGSHRAALESVSLLTMARVVHERMTQCISLQLVHAEALRIMQQMSANEKHLLSQYSD